MSLTPDDFEIDVTQADIDAFLLRLVNLGFEHHVRMHMFRSNSILLFYNGKRMILPSQLGRDLRTLVKQDFPEARNKYILLNDILYWASFGSTNHVLSFFRKSPKYRV